MARGPRLGFIGPAICTSSGGTDNIDPAARAPSDTHTSAAIERTANRRRLMMLSFMSNTVYFWNAAPLTPRYRHRSPGVVTYVFQRYPHGSTSGTTTTPGKMPENESAMSGSSVWPRYGGSHAASTQMSFHMNSKISSGIILTGYRTPRRQSSVSAPKKLIPTPCQNSHGCV